MKRIKIKISPENAGLKIDKAILATGVEMSRKELRRILDKGGIECNGKKVFVASLAVKAGDHILIHYHESLSAKDKEWGPLTKKEVLYWDQNLLAVNKAPGLNSVPTSSGQGTYVKKLLQPLLEKRELDPSKIYPCHRLDKETSGVFLLALNKEMLEWMKKQFQTFRVRKTYYAIVYGIPHRKKWETKLKLSDIEKKSGKVRVLEEGGHSSSTVFQLIAFSKRHNLSLLRVQPKTGRSHQIRVHLHHEALPVVGDKKYYLTQKQLEASLEELSFLHHYLHASSVECLSKDKSIIKIKAPFPQSFEDFLRKSQMEYIVKDPFLFG